MNAAQFPNNERRILTNFDEEMIFVEFTRGISDPEEIKAQKCSLGAGHTKSWPRRAMIQSILLSTAATNVTWSSSPACG